MQPAPGCAKALVQCSRHLLHSASVLKGQVNKGPQDLQGARKCWLPPRAGKQTETGLCSRRNTLCNVLYSNSTPPRTLLDAIDLEMEKTTTGRECEGAGGGPGNRTVPREADWLLFLTTPCRFKKRARRRLSSRRRPTKNCYTSQPLGSLRFMD